MADDLLNKLERLAKLKEQGVITEDEFAAQKAALIGPQKEPAIIYSTPIETSSGKKKLSGKTVLWIFLGFLGVGILNGIFGDNKPPVASKSEPVAEPPKTRKEIIEGFFSGWDGSHRELEKAIKSSMNDPDSYEHVETRYKDNGNTIYVLTKFRGKNAFGGVIVNYAEATIDGNDGHLIEWKFLK